MHTENTRNSLSPTSAKLNNTRNTFLVEPPKPPARHPNYIKEILIAAADDSTTHGIDHFFKRHHPFIRLVWAVCFFASAAICFYMIAMSILAYLDYETVTKAQHINELTADFPTVSICNLNPYLTNSSWAFVEDILVKNGLLNPLAPTAAFQYIFSDYLLIFRFLSGINSINPNLADSLRKSFGYDLNETLLSCIYNIYNMEICTVDDFEWYYDIVYGNCYKFNSGKYRNGSTAQTKQATKSGSINGLAVELFLYKTSNAMSLSTENGLHVLVHNKSDYPGFYNGVSIAAGTKAGVEIERVFTYHMPKPYSDCTEDIDETYQSDLVQTMLQTGYKYTQQNCFLACYQSIAFERCGCYDMYAKAITGVPVMNVSQIVFCTNYTQVMCDSQGFMTYFSNNVQTLCGDRCPLECDSIDYNMYTSYSDFPSDAYANSLMQNPKIQAKYASNPSDLTYDSLKRNMALVSVYYSDLGYQKYEELENMSLGDLISGFGGTLGLFLGMSFLSFIEIVDVILQIILYKKPTDNKITP